MKIIILISIIFILIFLIIVFSVNSNTTEYDRAIDNEQQLKFIEEYKKRK